MEARKIRVAILNSHPIQYFAPLYSYLNLSGDLEVTALYSSDISLRGGDDPGFGRAIKWDIDLLAGYRAVFLGERARTRVPRGFWSLVAPEVWAEVRSGRYDFLWLHGHNYAVNIVALMAAKTRGIPVMMRGETHLGLRRGALKLWLRSILMRAFYKTCDRFLAIGSANHDFYRAMGVADAKIFKVPYTVDNARFIAASGLSAGDRSDWRRRLGVDSAAPVILYASKLIARKRPLDLIHAAAMLSEQKLDFRVVFVGSGELEAQARALVERLGLKDVVLFAGFFNQSELPKVYGASDVFVLPSEDEPWGLVVNEVMCAGLPVVTTDDVGCACDLVVQRENGFVYPAGDVGALAVALAELVQSPELRGRMGAASLERISMWSYAECAEGVARAVGGAGRGKPHERGGHDA